MEGAVLHPEALAKMRKLGGEVLVRRLVGLYLELAPQRVAAGREALATGDHETAERSFHSLRSSSANVGASEVSRLAGLLEDSVRRGEEDLGQAVDALEAELAQALEALRQLIP